MSAPQIIVHEAKTGQPRRVKTTRLMRRTADAPASIGGGTWIHYGGGLPSLHVRETRAQLAALTLAAFRPEEDR